MTDQRADSLQRLAHLGADVLADVLEHFPDAVTLSQVVRDTDGRAVDMRIEWMNAAARAGQPDPAAAVGRACSDLWPQMRTNGSFDACMRVLETGIPQTGEFYWTERETYRPAGYDYKAVRVGRDRLLWILRDSTQRVRQMLERDAQLQAIFDFAPEGIAWLSTTGRVLAANGSLARIHRCAPAALNGKNYLDRCDAADRPRVAAALSAALDGPVPAFEVRVVADTGARVHVRLSVAALPAPTGETSSLVVHAQDVTAEMHLRHVERLGVIGELAGGLAHDFNNLLTLISSNAELARDALADGGPLDELDGILKAVKQGAQLTRQILTFARRDTDAPTEVDLNAVVHESVGMLRGTLTRQVRVDTILEPNVPLVCADRGEMSQLVLNLALNARDAMPGGGNLVVATSTVEVGEDDLPEWPELRPGPYVRLTIGDSGSGMPADVLARAFEPYFTTKPKGRGTGLGLATVQAIATRWGGAVRLRSEAGQGTVVRVLFPVAEPVRREEPRGAGPASIGRVLVVDDEPAFVSLAARLLDGVATHVTTTTDPEEAMRLARDEEVDVLLTDMLMPRLSGRALAERVRALRPGVRVVLMSGFAGGVLRRGATPLPHDTAVIEKPFTRADLLRALQRAAAG